MSSSTVSEGVERGDAALAGRCWKLSDGLEVWSVSRARLEVYCRLPPAFRAGTFELSGRGATEYREDGEAVVRTLRGGPEIIFEL
jgi:hypothetical protein